MIELDEESGVFRRRIRSAARVAQSCGWGTIVRDTRPLVAALYERERGGEIVQLGSFRRALHDPLLELEAVHATGPYYRFTARYSGVVEMTVVYWSSIAWVFGEYDPERHSSEGDFFLFLLGRWRDAMRASARASYRVPGR
jgi:hypothetical protein